MMESMDADNGGTRSPANAKVAGNTEIASTEIASIGIELETVSREAEARRSRLQRRSLLALALPIGVATLMFVLAGGTAIHYHDEVAALRQETETLHRAVAAQPIPATAPSEPARPHVVDTAPATNTPSATAPPADTAHAVPPASAPPVTAPPATTRPATPFPLDRTLSESGAIDAGLKRASAALRGLRTAEAPPATAPSDSASIKQLRARLERLKLNPVQLEGVLRLVRGLVPTGTSAPANTGTAETVAEIRASLEEARAANARLRTLLTDYAGAASKSPRR